MSKMKICRLMKKKRFHSTISRLGYSRITPSYWKSSSARLETSIARSKKSSHLMRATFWEFSMDKKLMISLLLKLMM